MTDKDEGSSILTDLPWGRHRLFPHLPWPWEWMGKDIVHRQDDKQAYRFPEFVSITWGQVQRPPRPPVQWRSADTV